MSACAMCGRGGGHVGAATAWCGQCRGEYSPTQLYAWAAACGYTPTQLAADLGVSRQIVARGLRGEPLGLPMSRRLAELTGIPLAVLLDGEPDPMAD